MIDLLPHLSRISRQYILDPDDVHGLSHWARVLENGLRIAEEEGGDRTVIRLFAIFHDACRHNQSWDAGHGNRAAVLAERLLQADPDLNQQQLDLLIEACRGHTDGRTDADLTVQICWDADRLDLARVNIQPRPNRLCTLTAKKAKIIHWASERARKNYTPGYVIKDWSPIFHSLDKSGEKN